MDLGPHFFLKAIVHEAARPHPSGARWSLSRGCSQFRDTANQATVRFPLDSNTLSVRAGLVCPPPMESHGRITWFPAYGTPRRKHSVPVRPDLAAHHSPPPKRPESCALLPLQNQRPASRSREAVTAVGGGGGGAGGGGQKLFSGTGSGRSTACSFCGGLPWRL